LTLPAGDLIHLGHAFQQLIEEFIFHGSPPFLDDLTQQFALLIGQFILAPFGVSQQENDLRSGRKVIVNHSRATAFAMAIGCNADFSKPSSSLDYITGIWVLKQPSLQRSVGLVIDEIEDLPGENLGFYEDHPDPSCVIGVYED
jgi:hypothetical protein